MSSRVEILREAIEQMRNDPDPRWNAVADLISGGPLSYARLLDTNPRQNPSSYPDADRAVNVANAYLNR